MIKNKFSSLLIYLTFFNSLPLLAQIPQVPAELEFADLIVRINPQARREIQLDVDAQYRNPNYLKVKQDRVNLYMPIIEGILRDNGVPEDFKYLVIQESSLIADAVSTSNAVGFWQFKQGTAEEVFLRVDNHIDERKNIVSSTRGAALYLKKHNNTFDNWMCALVSYQMGLGGAKAYFGTRYNGKRIIDVDRNTHWYFKKFLAHKIAFESQIGVFTSNSRLVEVPVKGPTSLAALAKKYGVSESQLEEYNKWTSNGKIPNDRTYSLVYLQEGSLSIQPAIIQENKPKSKNSTNATSNSPAYKQANSFPRIDGNTIKANQPNQITVNDIDGVKASKTTTQSNFSDQIGLKERKLRKLNDLEPGERIEAGEYYYTKKKKTKADVENHIVMPGETLWSISQKYGIKLSSLKAKNRIRKDSDLKVGMVLNLQEHRKRGEEIKIVKINQSAPPKKSVLATNNANTRTQQEVKTMTPPIQSASSKLTHVVSKGETLFAISKKYGVTVNDLKSWNNIGSQNIISIGQKLVIFTP
ncbi:LysM peptidoglycan-binding domain-containing protein [Algoriphagus sp. SE2]|uniref:lytic transglycosylase domain-containing protein n=1 Tax=Algoriphagus sp. SE2 TaxID=3141536 RepID=UPI0031CD7B80